MAEIAGLALGALPLALYAIDNYEKALSPFKDFFHYRSVLRTIQRELFAQKEQLRATLRYLDLEDPTPEEICERLQQLYPNSYLEFIEILSRMDDIMMDMLNKLDVDQRGKV